MKLNEKKVRPVLIILIQFKHVVFELTLLLIMLLIDSVTNHELNLAQTIYTFIQMGSRKKSLDLYKSVAYMLYSIFSLQDSGGGGGGSGGRGSLPEQS